MVVNDQLRATAAMIQARWPGRWEGDLARRLEELTTKNQKASVAPHPTDNKTGTA